MKFKTLIASFVLSLTLLASVQTLHASEANMSVQTGQFLDDGVSAPITKSEASFIYWVPVACVYNVVQCQVGILSMGFPFWRAVPDFYNCRFQGGIACYGGRY